MKLRFATIAGLMLLFFAPQLIAADQPTELPADLQELLPANAAVLVTMASVEELDKQLADLEQALADDEDEEPVDLLAMLSEQLPRFDEIVDPGRPLAMAVDMTPVIMGQNPWLTWVVPLKKSFTDRENLGLDAENSSSALQGDYLAIHSAPGYLPGGVRPELAVGLVPGVVSAAMDLSGLMQTYGPFVEMGLASIPVGVVETDTLASGEIVETPGMTQEEADALAGIVRALVASVDRLDLGFGSSAGMVRLDTRLAVLPDSPLSPGPQPDFDQALQLTRLLPAGGDFLMAIAMDMTPQFDIFKDFYVLNMRREAEKMENGDAYAKWFEEYLAMVPMWAHPLAASYRFGEDGMIAHAVMASPDPAADVEQLAGMLASLSNAGIGLTLNAQPPAEIDGVAVRNWTIDFDADTMTGVAGTPTNPQISGMGRMQAEQVTGVLQKIVPGLSLAAADGYVFIAADDDPARMAGMLAAAGKGGKPHAGAAQVAKASGPGTQEVVTGDLMAILKWVTAFMDEADQEEMAVVMDNPIPFNGAYTIAGQDFGFAMNMDVQAMQNLVRALDEMDIDEQMSTDAKDYSEEGKEEMQEKMEEGGG